MGFDGWGWVQAGLVRDRDYFLQKLGELSWLTGSGLALLDDLVVSLLVRF